MRYDFILDVSNEQSPIPVIRTSELLDIVPTGAILKVIVNKESAVKNIKTLISNKSYELLNNTNDPSAFELYIKK
ncbi:MAG TPA: sulfurtransferase TusA family protein [Methylophilaceae bacterium]|jgi:TusA-related sulfurtransferase